MGTRPGSSRCCEAEIGLALDEEHQQRHRDEGDGRDDADARGTFCQRAGQQDSHDSVEQQEGAQRLQAGDEVGAVALVREEQGDECGDQAEGDGCPA